MVYLKGLKFRGFKSFRRAEATFPKGFVCLAGPNGSGKSNVTDGIRFALGEGSLKALRAKRVSELINTSCKYAEVTLYIDGEQQYEIKRAINAEGKTLYRINGRRSTRTLVMEELRRYGIEAGSHNIIAQGQVQKIIDMSAKERRQIIDSVAGIAEFDAKKEEAIRELQKVEQKITEASIVLSERQIRLSELEGEKDSALAYISAQENFRRATASIANMEHSKLSKSFAEIVQKHSAAKAEIEALSKQSSVLEARIAELDSQKQQVVAKMGSSSAREAAMREIEELKVKIGADSATLNEKRKDLPRLEASSKTLLAQIEALKKSQKEVSATISSLSSEISSLSKKISEYERKSGAKSESAAAEVSRKLEFLAEKIVSLKEQKASCESRLASAERMMQMKREEKERLSQAIGNMEEGRFSGERAVLEKEIASLQTQLESLFERERELNRSLPDMDRRLLSLKEKAAALRASIAPSAASLAIKAVEEMKREGMRGIYGTVSSLVSCVQKYASAAEAAACNRLSYIVVDSTDTAIRVIERLKEQKAGRCTFIPLDIPKPQAQEPAPSASGCLGALIDFVKFDPAFKRAMEYVFSDTLLFDSVQNAKKHVGRARLVTVEGELIERSGVITGGWQKGSLLSRSALEKAEAEAAELEQKRRELYATLYSIRDEMSAKRKEKAEAEVKLRGLEIEQKSIEERKAGAKKTLEEIKKIEAELSALFQERESLKKFLAGLSAELSSSVSQHDSLKGELSRIASLEKSQDEESQKALRELSSRRSSLEAQLEAKKSELSSLASQQAEKERQLAELSASIGECRREIAELASALSSAQALQKEKEEKLSEMSASSQKLFAKMKELDAQIKEVADQLAKLKLEADRKNREMTELEIKRQTTETRLADLKAALEQYAGVPLIDASKAELEELAAKSEATMNSLGMVNLRAPELYEEKRREIEEIRSRVSSLDSEKKAVFAMMDEIEGKKRAIFLSTFSAINDNFKKIFSYILPGEGTLVLEQPSSPFESGLLIRVREEGRDKYLDSMSGGEKALLALIFIFAIQMHKPAPFYILDEADAALDKENSKKLSNLLKQLAEKTQFLVVTHNDTVLSSADVALGVTRTEDGSKIVGVQLTSAAPVAKPRKA
ncbi:MAG: chromosome segregation protein SMC [Candidatus Micrarchaeota archaeon]|nr:chromosome segregation protein SMC [Candidatus Micrarchaeota archaeon]